MLQVRAMYIIQLLVTIVSPSAKSLASLFQQFSKSDILESLALMDSCLLSYEALTAAWHAAIKDLLVNEKVDVSCVLRCCDVAPVTGQAEKHGLKVSGSGGGAQQPGEEDDDVTKPSVFSWKSLLNFGFSECEGLTADQLRSIELQVEAFVIDVALASEASWHDRLVLHLMDEPESSSGARSGQKKGASDGEVLLHVDVHKEEGSILHFAAMPCKRLYRLPEDLKLYFTGSIGAFDFTDFTV